MRRHPYLSAVYVILRVIVIALLIANLVERDYESAYICVLALISFLLPAFIQRQFRVL